MAKEFDKEAGEVDFYWLGEIWGLGVNMHVHEWEIREHEVTTLASHRQWEGKGEGYKCKLWRGKLVGLIWLGKNGTNERGKGTNVNCGGGSWSD